jgi:hypothetical protein
VVGESLPDGVPSRSSCNQISQIKNNKKNKKTIKTLLSILGIAAQKILGINIPCLAIFSKIFEKKGLNSNENRPKLLYHKIKIFYSNKHQFLL